MIQWAVLTLVIAGLSVLLLPIHRAPQLVSSETPPRERSILFRSPLFEHDGSPGLVAPAPYTPRQTPESSRPPEPASADASPPPADPPGPDPIEPEASQEPLDLWLARIPDLEVAPLSKEVPEEDMAPPPAPVAAQVRLPAPAPSTIRADIEGAQVATTEPARDTVEPLAAALPPESPGSILNDPPPAPPAVAPSSQPPLEIGLQVRNLLGAPLDSVPPVSEDLLEITVTLTNRGPGEASNILTRLVGSGVARLDHDSAVSDQGRFDTGLWDIPTLSPGDAASLSVLADLTAAELPGSDGSFEILAEFLSASSGTPPLPEDGAQVFRFFVLPRETHEEPSEECSVSGVVFIDLNGNAQRDEPLRTAGLDNIRVDLLTAEVRPQLLASQLTSTSLLGERGHYEFNGIAPGTYLLRLDLASLPAAAIGTSSLQEHVVSCPLAADDLDTRPDFALLLGPTAIELESFSARNGVALVRLEWTTAMEIENLGFHVHRAESETGERVRVTPDLIFGRGTGEGGTYEFADNGAAPWRPWYYWLEDIDWDFQSTFHGPYLFVP